MRSRPLSIVQPSLFAANAPEAPASVEAPKRPALSEVKSPAAAKRSRKAAEVAAPVEAPARVEAPAATYVLPSPRLRSTYERDTHARAVRTYAANVEKLVARFEGFPALQAKVRAAAAELHAAVPLVEAIPAGWRPAVWNSTPVPSRIAGTEGERVAVRPSAYKVYTKVLPTADEVGSEFVITAVNDTHVFIRSTAGTVIAAKRAHLEIPGATAKRVARDKMLSERRAAAVDAKRSEVAKVGF